MPQVGTPVAPKWKTAPRPGPDPASINPQMPTARPPPGGAGPAAGAATQANVSVAPQYQGWYGSLPAGGGGYGPQGIAGGPPAGGGGGAPSGGGGIWSNPSTPSNPMAGLADSPTAMKKGGPVVGKYTKGSGAVDYADWKAPQKSRRV